MVGELAEVKGYGDYCGLIVEDSLELEKGIEKVVYLNQTFYQQLYQDQELGFGYIQVKGLQGTETKLVQVKSRFETSQTKLGYVPLSFLTQVFELKGHQLPLEKSLVLYIWPCTPVVLTQVMVSFNLVSKTNGGSPTLSLSSIRNSLAEQLVSTEKPIYQNETVRLNTGSGEPVLVQISFCEPTQQGIVNQTTNFILVNDTQLDLKLSTDTEEEQEQEEEEVEQEQEVNSFLNPFDFLPNSFSTGLKSQPPLSLKVGKLDRQLDLKKYCSSTLSWDIHATIFLPLNYLKQLQVVSGDWVLMEGEVKGFKDQRWGQVFGLDTSTSQALGLEPKLVHYQCLIDPILHFHLFGNLDSTDRFYINLSKSTVEGSSPKVASSITLARINSPTGNLRALQATLTNQLKLHFSTGTRLVKGGDLIVVVVDAATAQLQLRVSGNHPTADQLSLVPPTAYQLGYFKVTQLKLHSNPTVTETQLRQVKLGLLVDRNQTQTIQLGSEASFVPCNLSNYFHLAKAPRFQSHQFHRLQELVQSALHPLATDLNLTCSILLHGARGSGKASLAYQLVDRFGLHLFEISCYDWVEESDPKTEDNFNQLFHQVLTYAPCLFLIRHLDALTKKSQATDLTPEPWLSVQFSQRLAKLASTVRLVQGGVVVIATTEALEPLPPRLTSAFQHDLEVPAPDANHRLHTLSHLTASLPLANDVDVPRLATESAGLVPKDLQGLVYRATQLGLHRVQHLPPHATKSGLQLVQGDFDAALVGTRSQYSDFIGAPKIPNVTWDDVGGLAAVKSAILDTIQLPLLRPELFASGAKQRSGILLFGPPGTGKTLLAKAVATTCALNFFSVKGPELLNMYIGESEANLRRVFQKARDAKPCVIFFDELDSVAPKRGEQGDSGGVMDRIVSQLLAELDGMGSGEPGSSYSSDLFVIGATNRPDLLDPALLRPGRFDKMLYLGVPEDHLSQLHIIKALTRKFRLDSSLDLQVVAEACPFHYTGADFYALCSDAMLKAMSRTAETLETQLVEFNLTQPHPIPISHFLDSVAKAEEVQVTVQLEDFMLALEELTPSVTPKDLERYQEIRRRFDNLRPEESNLE